MSAGDYNPYSKCFMCGLIIPEGTRHDNCQYQYQTSYKNHGGMIPPGSYTTMPPSTIPDTNIIYSMGPSGERKPQPAPRPEPFWLKPIGKEKQAMLKNFTTSELVQALIDREGLGFFASDSAAANLATKRPETAEQIRQRERSGNDYCANPESYWSEDWDDHQ